MANNPIGTIGIQIAANSQANIQKQIDAIAKKITLNIQNVNLNTKGVEEFKKKVSNSLAPIKNSTAEISNYEKSLNKLIHTYKMKEISDDKFMQNVQRAMQMQKYQQLSWKQQEQLINLVAKAEKNYQTVSDKTRTINEANAKSQQKTWEAQIKKFQTQPSLKNNTSSNTNSINQSTQAISNYEKAINSLIQKYKMKKTADEDFIRQANKIMEHSKFQTLSDQKQLQVLQQLTRAETNYNQSLATRSTLQQREANNNLRLIEQRIRTTSSLNAQRLREENATANFGNSTTRLQNRINNTSSSSLSQFVNPQEISGLQTRLNDLRNTFNQLGTATPQYRTRLAQLNEEFRQVRLNANNAERAANGFCQTLLTNVVRLATWTATATLLFGSFNQLKNGIKYIYDMNTAIVELSKVTNFSKQELNGMKDVAIVMGKELGKSSVEIMKSFAEFGRVAKDMESIKSLSNTAVMTSNVTSMTADVAAKAINTTMIAFKMNAKDSVKILDQWNELQNNYRKLYAV